MTHLYPLPPPPPFLPLQNTNILAARFFFYPQRPPFLFLYDSSTNPQFLQTVIVLACIVVAASASEVFFFADTPGNTASASSFFRQFNLADNSVAIKGVTKTPFRGALAANEQKGANGLSSIVAGADGNLYAIAAQDRQVWKYTNNNGVYTTSVFAGSGAAGKKVLGTGTSATFELISSMVSLSDGTLVVDDCGVTTDFPGLYKISPAGEVTVFAGSDPSANPVAGAAAVVDGKGTNAQFLQVVDMVVDSADNIYVMETAVAGTASVTAAVGPPVVAAVPLVNQGNGVLIRKVTPDGTVSTVAGQAAAFFTGTEGVGTNALLGGSQVMALSQDGKTMYVPFHSTADPGTFTNDGTNFAPAGAMKHTSIRKFDTATWTSETIMAVPSTVTFATPDKCVDGVGTAAVLCPITEMFVNSDGLIIMNQIGTNGALIKSLNVTSMELKTLAGSDASVTAVTSPTTAIEPAAPVELVDGVGSSASFVTPSAWGAVQEVCGKISKIGANVTLDACEELSNGGTVTKLIIVGETKVTKDLIVKEGLIVNPAGKIVGNSKIDVLQALVLNGNGTLVLNGFAATADSFMASADSTYQVLVNAAVPAILKVKNAANLAGTFVLAVDKDFNFVSGAAVTIIEFASRAGNFGKVFLVKLRTPATRRSLLQNAATGAGVNCGATACTAVGTEFAGDDDDEVGLIVALAIVGTILLLVICGACFLIMKKTSDKNVEQIVAGRTAQFDYSSTSSSSEFAGANQFADLDYYSYSY